MGPAMEHLQRLPGVQEEAIQTLQGQLEQLGVGEDITDLVCHIASVNSMINTALLGLCSTTHAETECKSKDCQNKIGAMKSQTAHPTVKSTNHGNHSIQGQRLPIFYCIDFNRGTCQCSSDHQGRHHVCRHCHNVRGKNLPHPVHQCNHANQKPSPSKPRGPRFAHAEVDCQQKSGNFSKPTNPSKND